VRGESVFATRRRASRRLRAWLEEPGSLEAAGTLDCGFFLARADNEIGVCEKPRRERQLHSTTARTMENAAMGAIELQPAGPGHPCKRMRLGGRQNNMPEEFCMASTCVSLPYSFQMCLHQRSSALF
jgi:hypothetical protein